MSHDIAVTGKSLEVTTTAMDKLCFPSFC